METKTKPTPRADTKPAENWTTGAQAQDNTHSTSTDPSLPPHMLLEKGPNLRESAKEMAGRKDKLEEEFKLIANHTRVNVKKESKVGRLEKNKPHNRYVDIGKYSHNDNIS